MVFIQGRSYPVGGSRDSINRLVISSNYFETMGMSVLLGRGLTERDDRQAPKVAVINEAAARMFFPNENPIGRRFGSTVETAGQLEVVGVLRDAKYDSLREAVEPTMYVPYLQQPRTPQAVFQIRTTTDPTRTIGAIRDAVRQIDPNLPLMNVSTQVEQMEQRLEPERVVAHAYALFGALALLLASVGVFGVTSYGVARRTNEIGIRMALGARAEDVLTLVMSESMMLVAIGIGSGLAIAVLARRLVATLLFGLVPTDKPTMLVVVIIMAFVCVVACYIPARRATGVDPLVALRYE